MRSLIGAIAMAAGVLVAASVNITPASAAPVAATSSGYDARPVAARVTDVSAQRRHRYHHHRHYRHYRPYYRPYGYGPGYGYYRPYYRPYYYRPYYYRPYSPVVPFYGFGFGFGW